MQVLLGKFAQVLTLRNLPFKGVLKDEQLEIIENAGIWIKEGKIWKLGDFELLAQEAQKQKVEVLEFPYANLVALPGFIDCHTHICFAGNRAKDYALRIAGESYLNIAKSGGGILDSVRKTRNATEAELTENVCLRADFLLKQGITTIEVKSGYGLSVEEELKQLRAIQRADLQTTPDLVPTCLAAHTLPFEFNDKKTYLDHIAKELLPILVQEKLCKRVDIFVEPTAFPVDIAKEYLLKAQSLGFELTIHADQFNVGGSHLAVELGACSADHLEASTNIEIQRLAESETVAVVLPGASLGLGMNFAPARKLLDAGACVAISTDWNPGSAPMGDLLLQASVIAANQKLSTAETLAGITFRAAKALNLHQHKGRLQEGFSADIAIFATNDYREILYWQGQMKPIIVWKNDKFVEF
ncbi:MAG: imidazolonepropionase [Raineya sp.]|nr:imidazolonepropionase [Raineya sp.]